MAVRYVAASAQGTGDGSSSANAAAWTDLDNQINLASLDPGTYEVRIIKEGQAYTWSGPGQMATIVHGGTDVTKQVVVHGWSLNSASEDYVTITSNRSSPYVPPATGNDDVYQPAGSNGAPGFVLLNLASGANHLTFAALTLNNLQSLFTVNAVVNDINGRDIAAYNCRRLWACTDSTNANPTGIKGTSSSPVVWQRVRAYGFTKQLMYLSGCSYLTVRDIFGDAQNQSYDGNPSLVSLTGNTAASANDHIVIERFDGRNMITPVYAATPYRVLIAPGGSVPTGGTFTLTYNGGTSSAIPYSATNAQVKSALAAIGGLSSSQIFVSGSLIAGLTLSLGQDKLVTDPGAITIDSATLTGGTYALATSQAWSALQPGYWQGDGITTEEYDTSVLIRNGSISSMGDAGCDLKSVNTVIKNVTVTDAKRSFRVHHPSAAGLTPVIERCRSLNPRIRSYAAGQPLAGTQGTGTQCALQADGSAIVHDLYHSEDANSWAANTNVFEADSSTGVVAVIEAKVNRRTGSTLSAALSSGTVSLHGVTDTIS